MTPFPIHDWLLLARKIVSMQRADAPCERLNSFLTIDSKFDFVNDFMEAKTKNPYFFSRSEQKVEFPGFVLTFDSATLSEPKGDKYTQYCHPFEIGVVDQQIYDCKNCTPCEKRNKLQITFDAEVLLRKMIGSLSQIGLYKVVKGAEESFVYHYQPILDLEVTAGIYDSYSEVSKETNLYRERFKQNNPKFTFTILDMPKINGVYTFTDINICEICTSEDMEFSYKTYRGCC